MTDAIHQDGDSGSVVTHTRVPAPSLAAVAARGSVVMGFVTVGEQGTLFLRALVLARILSPHDFGLMGMALVVVFTAEALSQTGLNRALVQKRGDPREDLDTVWLLSALRGALLYGIIWLLSPTIAAFFETPEALPVLRTTALAFLIQGLINPAYFLLEREMAFVRVAWPILACVLCDLAVAVILALVLRSVWSMVWGFLLGKAVFVLCSFAVLPWRPTFNLSLDRALDLYRYGRHVFRAAVVDCIVGQGDRALIGRFMGSEALGFYSLAARIASLPSIGGVHSLVHVAFPLFSKVQEEAHRLRAALLRSLALTSALVLPVAAGLWVTAKDLVAVLFGAKWIDMTPPFEVLAVAGAPAALYQLLRMFMSAIGRPDTAARGAYIYLIVFAVPLYPAILTLGSVGAAWCCFAAGAVSVVFLMRESLRASGAESLGAVRALGVPAGAALVMVGAVAAGRALMAREPSVVILGVEVVVGAGVFVLALAALDRLLGTGIVAEVRSFLRAIGWPAVRAIPGPENGRIE